MKSNKSEDLEQQLIFFLFAFRVFLLRDSQSNPKTFVLSLCHMQKIKHFQILPVSLSYMLQKLPANLSAMFCKSAVWCLHVYVCVLHRRWMMKERYSTAWTMVAHGSPTWYSWWNFTS